MSVTERERLIDQLQKIRDNLCVANARNNAVQGQRWCSGYGSGVEAFWEAAEDAVKALEDHGAQCPADEQEIG